jgi:hypothetical protein
VKAASSPDRESRPAGLRRELKFWEAIALSIAIMSLAREEGLVEPSPG